MTLRRVALVLAVILVAAGAIAYTLYARADLIEFDPIAKTYVRRSGALSVNLGGTFGAGVTRATYRINGGPWHVFEHHAERSPSPRFVLEVTADELKQGLNKLKLAVQARARSGEAETVEFTYDSSPVELPTKKKWTDGDVLDQQDGPWEIKNGRVRPVPGTEAFDRLLIVTGAFAGSRRVKTTLIFRSGHEKKPFGFGVIPFWGGHPEKGKRPRLGWRYGLAWYYSWRRGLGAEFAERIGRVPPKWISSYRGFTPKPGVVYHLLAEGIEEPDGRTVRYKFWKDGDEQPKRWHGAKDADGGNSKLPDGEYAVALVAHRAQVEFGPVSVERVRAVR